MQIRPSELRRHLEGRPFAPVYVVGGEEPLQIEESLDLIRGTARTRGYEERIVLEGTPELDWSELEQSRCALSLFASRRVVELRLPSGRPGEAGGRALGAWADAVAGEDDRGRARGDPETLLVVRTGALDARTRRARWFRKLESAGVAVLTWQPGPRELPRWVRARLAAHGLDATPEALAALVARHEGNLLACAQSIRRLALLKGTGGGREAAVVDLEDVRSAISDHARFDTFDLVDAALGGDGPRALRVLAVLRAEGEEPPAVLGTLAWAVRALAGFAAGRARGRPSGELIAREPAWRRRQAQVEGTLARLTPEDLGRIMEAIGVAELAIKSGATRNPWEWLAAIASTLAGQPVLPLGPPAGPWAALIGAGHAPRRF